MTLETLTAIADAAAQVIREHTLDPEARNEVAMGADGTSTSLIDKLAEDAALEANASRGNRYNILSEEAGFIDNGAEKTILMDPVDGTYNFKRGIPFYAVSLAIGKEWLSDIETALVRNVVTGDTFTAEKGKGAMLNGRAISVKPFVQRELIVSAYFGYRAGESNYRLSKESRRARSFGSAALEMCMVACGQLDLYQVLTDDGKGATRIVDIGASTLILREAGGEVYDENFEILDTEFDVVKRLEFIAVGDKKIIQHLEGMA